MGEKSMADKLGWDADFYNSQSDETINISLTRKEIYLLGNLLPMINWTTRWSGDISGLDLDAIQGNLEYQLLDEIGVGTMTCEDIANCIDTDETVQTAIENQTTQTLQSEGYEPKPDTTITDNPPPTLKTSAKSENLMPIGFDCATQPQLVMGKARELVRELHETAEDFFELVEYLTNQAEALSQAISHIPVLGKVASSAIEFVDWVIETMAENYMAAYNQTVEDELACMLFCHMMDNCEMSINDLISLYEAKGTITTPPPDDIQALIDFAIDLPATVSVAGVAAFHWLILRILSWGTFGGFSAAYLKMLLSNFAASDYTYKDTCEDCPQDNEPTVFWRLYYDFFQTQEGWEIADTTSTEYAQGCFKGKSGVTAGGASIKLRDLGLNTLGGTWAVHGVFTEVWSIDPETSGSGDHFEQTLYSGVNLATQVGSYGNVTIGAKPTWGVEHRGQANATTPTSWRSIRIRRTVSGGVMEEGVRMAKIQRVVIIGKPDGNGNKPARAHWWRDTLPATSAEYFD